MSVLIKGIEMPDDCKTCELCHYDDDLWGFCFVNDEKIAEKGRRDDCPLIEVPTPHGRLIDADKMEKEVCGGCKHGEHKYENCIDCALANAPTVIEAEGE